jgi:hypothetical protein
MKLSTQRKELHSDENDLVVSEPRQRSGLRLIQPSAPKRVGLIDSSFQLLKNPLVLSAALWIGLLLMLIRAL